jgi:hypothetical protein
VLYDNRGSGLGHAGIKSPKTRHLVGRHRPRSNKGVSCLEFARTCADTNPQKA